MIASQTLRMFQGTRLVTAWILLLVAFLNLEMQLFSQLSLCGSFEDFAAAAVGFDASMFRGTMNVNLTCARLSGSFKP